MSERRVFRIVQEVPGVPLDEAYFVNGPGLSYPYPNFAKCDDARDWIVERYGDVEIVVEWFGP